MKSLKQWKNNREFLLRYNNLSDKSKLTFYQFDICKFYLSISEKLIKKAIEFARKYIHISEEDEKLIIHTCKSFIYNKGQAWVKKGKSIIDVTMGGFAGAEKCDLVGLYLLSKLAELGLNGGLFRDDGAAVTNLSPKEAEKLKNKIAKVFKAEGLDITIQDNLKAINFLNVEVDMATGTHQA